VLGSALSNFRNIFIIAVLDDFCLSPAYFYNRIIKVWDFELKNSDVISWPSPWDTVDCEPMTAGGRSEVLTLLGPTS
jgi:hypothetical protein